VRAGGDRAENREPRAPAPARVRHGLSGVDRPFLRGVTMCSCGGCADCRARADLAATLRDRDSSPMIARLARRLTKRRHRPERVERPVCGARTRAGGRCCARVVWIAGELAPRSRCRVHGGLSTGPKGPKRLASDLAATVARVENQAQREREVVARAERAQGARSVRDTLAVVRSLSRLIAAAEKHLAGVRALRDERGSDGVRRALAAARRTHKRALARLARLTKTEVER
jgi:hypothetical protein